MPDLAALFEGLPVQVGATEEPAAVVPASELNQVFLGIAALVGVRDGVRCVGVRCTGEQRYGE